jgi:glycosyltransferase involved in cell wall biosynthesis
VEASATVVITTRNRRDLLAQAIDSVLRLDPRVPLVVVDDGSTDDTEAWLAASSAGRLEVVRHDEAIGLPGARNAGLERVRTRYVLFLDDDDALVPGGLTRLTSLLDRRPSAVAAVGGRLRFGAGTPTVLAPVVRRESERWIHREVLLGWVAMSGQTLFRFDALQRAGRWNAGYRAVAEDQELWLRLSLVGPVAFHPAPVVWNRAHGDQSRPDDVREVEDDMRRIHVAAALDGCRPADDRRVLDARRSQLAAFERYREDHPWDALRLLLEHVVAAPWVFRSPLTRGAALGFLTRCVISGVVGRRFLVRVGARLRAWRGASV